MFIREIVTDSYECRCFVYHKQLTAISVYSQDNDTEFDKDQIRQDVLKKFNEFKHLIPFNDVIIDMYYPSCIIIELNSFGPDMPCGAGKFDWNEDYFQLHGALDNIAVR